MPSVFTQFQAAITNGDDTQTEALVMHLQPSDCAALQTLYETTDPDVRWWAVRAFAHVGGASTISTVGHALTDMDSSVRAVATFALGTLYAKHPPAVEPLLPQLGQRLMDEDGLVRQTAVDGLAMCGDAAVPVLADLLQAAPDEAHEGARTRATIALGKIATMAAAGVLYRHLNDGNYLVHTYAYEALDKMGLLENVLVTL